MRSSSGCPINSQQRDTAMNDLPSILVNGAVCAVICTIIIRLNNKCPVCWIAEIAECFSLYVGMSLVGWMQLRHPDWSPGVKGLLLQVAMGLLVIAPTWVMAGKIRAVVIKKRLHKEQARD